MLEFNWVLILVGAAAILILINIFQLISAFRKKKKAEMKIKEIDKEIEALKKDLEKEKGELQVQLQERIKKFMEGKK
ncbi:MAG: hypothetical protein V3T21_06890 [Candidatus Margulisiibacteriota bacterium]